MTPSASMTTPVPVPSWTDGCRKPEDCTTRLRTWTTAGATRAATDSMSGRAALLWSKLRAGGGVAVWTAGELAPLPERSWHPARIGASSGSGGYCMESLSRGVGVSLLLRKNPSLCSSKWPQRHCTLPLAFDHADRPHARHPARDAGLVQHVDHVRHVLVGLARLLSQGYAALGSDDDPLLRQSPRHIDALQQALGRAPAADAPRAVAGRAPGLRHGLLRAHPEG